MGGPTGGCSGIGWYGPRSRRSRGWDRGWDRGWCIAIWTDDSGLDRTISTAVALPTAAAVLSTAVAGGLHVAVAVAAAAAGGRRSSNAGASWTGGGAGRPIWSIVWIGTARRGCRCN